MGRSARGADLKGPLPVLVTKTGCGPFKAAPLGLLLIKRAATHSGTVFSTVSQNDAFSCPGAYSDAIFAFYARNRSSGAFRLSIGVEEDPMYGEALHLGYQQPSRPTGRCIGKPGAVRDLPLILKFLRFQRHFSFTHF